MLTKAQEETVQNTSEHKLVLALPGSGKTHTSVELTKRILQQFAKNSVLMTTFTNAAAAEMRQRVIKSVGKENAQRVLVNTFASLMMAQFKPLQKGRRSVMGAEQMSYVRRAVNELRYDMDELSLWASEIDLYGRDVEFQDDNSAGARLFHKYIELLTKYKRYDLNMMVRELIIGMDSGVVRPYQFSHIICDEFQDTDLLQYEWLRAHGRNGSYITVVGDDDQSIYGWRGAMGYQGFVRLQEDFGASGYLLDTCFRCSPNILYSAKKLIEYNQDRIDKDMYSKKLEPGEVRIVEIPKEFVSKRRYQIEESDVIDNKAERIKALKPNEHYRYVAEEIEKSGQIWAVLARTNKQLDKLEEAFSELSIEVFRIGGSSIFDNIHAVGIANLFYGLVNHKAANCLEQGLGWLGEKDEAIHSIFNISSKAGFSAVSSLDTDCLSVTLNLHNASVGWGNCTSSIESDANIKLFKAEILKHVIRKKDKDFEFQKTILDICCNTLATTKGSLRERAQYLLDKVNTIKTKTDMPRDRIVLATKNGSKGLEWPNVWLIDIEDGKSPLLIEDTIEKLEEERRLMFVAMTRAEDRLVISYRVGKESEFIEEIEN